MPARIFHFSSSSSGQNNNMQVQNSSGALYCTLHSNDSRTFAQLVYGSRKRKRNRTVCLSTVLYWLPTTALYSIYRIRWVSRNEREEDAKQSLHIFTWVNPGSRRRRKQNLLILCTSHLAWVPSPTSLVYHYRFLTISLAVCLAWRYTIANGGRILVVVIFVQDGA